MFIKTSAEFLNLHNEYPNVQRWMKTLEERDAVKRGLRVNGWGAKLVKERHSKGDFDMKVLKLNYEYTCTDHVILV